MMWQFTRTNFLIKTNGDNSDNWFDVIYRRILKVIIKFIIDIPFITIFESIYNAQLV